MVEPTPSPVGLRGRADALLVAVLLIARLRIDTLAEAAVLPLRLADSARHPLLGRLLPVDAAALLAQQGLVDPIGLLLIVASLALLIAYLLVSELVHDDRARYRAKMALLWGIVGVAVIAPSLKMVLLRQASGPASYSHDGGVIQTEAAIEFVLEGRNPYQEDYTKTPMAEWGLDEFRTALYHYPYLPWTFLFSAPFKGLADVTLGWFDQRLIYLLLFGLTLVLSPSLARTRADRLLLFIFIALNPIMGSDLIYGQNDSFVLAWLMLSFWCYSKGSVGGSAGWLRGAAFAYGLACASKPTAWFLAPFYLVLLLGSTPAALWRQPVATMKRVWSVAWPGVAVFAALLGPYLVTNPGALYDDVWRWSSGSGESAYQIWGWGGSNLVLALGWVTSRFDYWPFWLSELLVGAPLLALLLKRQLEHNNLGRALWSYGFFLMVFFFFSRFLNENYLGFILAFIAIGTLATPSAVPRVSAEVVPTD